MKKVEKCNECGIVYKTFDTNCRIKGVCKVCLEKIKSVLGYGICTECNKEDELRPYGKNQSLICYDCGLLNEEIVEENMRKVLNGELPPAENSCFRVLKH